MIYYLMGKSASGKDSIYQCLRQRCPLLRPLVLYTTRPIRAGETEGESYHFIDETRLEQLRAEGRVVEERCYQTVHGPWYYATVADEQLEALARGADYLAIGTLESYRRLQAYFGRQQLYPLYIEVPDELRLARATERECRQPNPSMAELKRRFAADASDFSEEKLREAGIERRYQNIELEACVNEILKDTGQ